ncbi:MAG: peptidylprolyl isomerase [Acetivibrionales bacterium]
MNNNDTKKDTGGTLTEEKTGMPIFAKYGLIAAAIILVIAIGLVIYFNAAPKIVATVDGEKITEAEFLYYLDLQKQFMYESALYQDPSITEETFWATKIGGEEPVEVAKKMTLEGLKNIKVQYRKAKEANIKLTKDEIANIDSVLEIQVIQPMGGGNRIKANKAVKELYGFGIDDLKDIQVQASMVRKYQMDEIEKITDADIEDYYAKNTDAFKADTRYRYGTEEAVWAKHILITVGEDASQEEEDAALKKAEELIERLKDGEDFATLASENSEDGSRQWGGDYLFGKGKMVEEFEETAFALEPGQFTEEPVRTQFGYHIIKLEEKYGEGEPASLRCAKEYVEFGSEYIFEQRINELVDKADFKIENSVYSSIK